jgi:putative endonuclease
MADACARPNPKGQIGQLGEKLAARHLTALGCRLLARNYRVGRLGELDLVMLAEDGVTLCFVEVKTRTGMAYGRPAEAVTADKRRRIRRMAQVFLQSQAVHQGKPLRFDVVEVMIDKTRRTARVHHIPQAF